MSADLLLALLKCLLLPAAGVVGFLGYLLWWLRTHPDANDWADHT